MLAIVAGWDLYQATRSAIVLGNVGLVQIVPVFLFTFIAGHVADHYDRRRTVLITQVVLALIGFVLAGAGAHRSVSLIYSALFLGSASRAFQWPVTTAMMPQTVPGEILTNAVSWNGTAREAATVGGPALAGLLIGVFGSEAVYLTQALCSVVALLCFTALKLPPVEPLEDGEKGWSAVAQGLSFVWREKIILSTMTLDMLAVLFGGATALLPIFASDILHIGASGLGWLRAAPAVGAALMSLYLAHHSNIRNAGLVLLGSVAMFGVATIGFGLATVGWLSFLMLFFTGVFDAVSVVLRISLVQMRTPDALRGRVAAVNGLFISSSNQWGAVESGLAAAWLGTVPAVVWGGVATIVVAGIIGAVSRSLRTWRQ
jgi:MFS family permease